MLKKIALAAGLALAFAGAAQAQTCSCDSNAVALNTAALQALLPGKMVCGTVGNESWQEWHGGGGELWDYKLGPARPGNVDPETIVGSWSIGNDNVTYNYGAGGSYTYQVCSASNSLYTFCGPRVIPGIKIGGTGSRQACATVANSASIVRSTAVRR